MEWIRPKWESLSYVLDDITPKKAGGDSGHQSTNSGSFVRTLFPRAYEETENN